MRRVFGGGTEKGGFAKRWVSENEEIFLYKNPPLTPLYFYSDWAYSKNQTHSAFLSFTFTKFYNPMLKVEEF